MNETTKKYYPKFPYLLLNIVVTILFFGFAWFLFTMMASMSSYGDRIEPMFVIMALLCIIAPIVLNIATIPHYKIYGVDDDYFSVNGKKYEWKNVSLAGYETHEKRVTLAVVFTVARTEEENMKIVILEPGTSRILKKYLINNKIFKEYFDIEYEIKEHLKKTLPEVPKQV